MLISTEAGGEGRNFQFCHNLVNYDLPWNPMKIEQRIGRLDRIGQKHPVKIFNFSMLGTIEERVLDVLTNRIRVFEETIGGLDPILGEVENDIRKVFLMADAEGKRALRDARQAAGRPGARGPIGRTASGRPHHGHQVLPQGRGRATAGRSRHRQQRHAPPLHPDGADRARRDRREALRDRQRLLIQLRGGFENEFPHLAKDARSRTGTFDPSIAREHEELEFFAIGHEMVDALIARCTRREYGGRASYRRRSGPTNMSRPAAGSSRSCWSSRASSAPRRSCRSSSTPTGAAMTSWPTGCWSGPAG